MRASPHDNRESNAMKSTRRNDPYRFANYMRKVFDILTDLDRWERRKMSVQRSCTNIGKCADLRCRRRKRCQKLEWVTSNTEALRTRRAALQATWPTVKPTSNPSPDTRKGAPECALDRVACACCAMRLVQRRRGADFVLAGRLLHGLLDLLEGAHLDLADALARHAELARTGPPAWRDPRPDGAPRRCASRGRSGSTARLAR